MTHIPLRVRASWLLATMLPVLVACDNTVTITYQEIATCHTVEGGYGGSAPGAEYHVFYKILSVANTGKDASDFNFGPGNLLYQADVPIPLAIPPAGVTAAPGVVVAKGMTWAGPGKGAVGLQGPARQALLSNPTHPLTYDPSGPLVRVDVVAAPYNRVDLDHCSIAQLQSL
jgi:hypothetical protein